MNAPVRSEILVGGTLQTARLSPVHSMLVSIDRQLSAAAVNEMWNHPAVRPTIGAGAIGPTARLDWSKPVANPNNVFLIGDRGAISFVRAVDGMFETHLGVLPEGRGEWARLFVQAACHWMFTRSIAIELFAYCPHANPFVAKMARRLGWTYELTRPDGFANPDGSRGPVDVYQIGLLSWSRSAPGLVERGRWFFSRLTAEYRRFNVAAAPPRVDEDHLRMVGLFVELLLGDNVGAAMTLFNKRFALFSGWKPIELVAVEPVIVVKAQGAVLFFRDQDFYIHSLG